MEWNSPVSALKGIGEQRERKLQKLNIYTVEDLGTPYGHVDIYFDNHSDALSFGLQYADVYQVG